MHSHSVICYKQKATSPLTWQEKNRGPQTPVLSVTRHSPHLSTNINANSFTGRKVRLPDSLLMHATIHLSLFNSQFMNKTQNLLQAQGKTLYWWECWITFPCLLPAIGWLHKQDWLGTRAYFQSTPVFEHSQGLLSTAQLAEYQVATHLFYHLIINQKDNPSGLLPLCSKGSTKRR